MADFNYNKEHARAYYNRKGQIFWAHSKEDELRAKEQGFTSTSYVRSEWPKTAYRKGTGETKTVGKLENTDEQNLAAVKALGDEWGLDHVPTPEPVTKAETKEGSAGDMGAVLALAGEFALLRKRVEELEDAAVESETIRVSLENRISELEQQYEPEVPAAPAAPPVPPQVDDSSPAEKKPKAK